MTRHTDHNIWPGITSPDPMALRAWLAQLGFVEGGCYLAEDGVTVQHSEMLWPEGGRVMISGFVKHDRTFEVTPGSTSSYVVVDHPDEVWAAAQALSATVIRPMREEDYGSRGFSIADPDGNVWSFGTYSGEVAG
jgi:uncharacterized glyoxalase superfamily protein PhnB